MSRCFFLLIIILALTTAFSSPAAAQEDQRAIIYREDPEPARPDWAPFLHGVASGDPLPDQVIIWTRVSPEEGNAAVEVTWKVATDPQLRNVVQSGTTAADASSDFTVKIDVAGLSPGLTYYYGFSAQGRHSLTGKTKTAPAGSQAGHLRFGVVSCNSFQVGFFNAYKRLAQRNDLDAIVHLGDYIYESYSTDGPLIAERPVAPENKLITLGDYRARYASYRLDTTVIRAHQQHPFIAVWDDHEFSDNAYKDGAETHYPETDGDWETRKAAALQAYFEWMPVRKNIDNSSIYRKFSYGNLIDLLLLDTRLEGRDKQIYDPFDEDIQASDRTILGAAQKNWLINQLTASQAKWKIIAQQVPFAPFELGWSAALDQDPQTRYDQIQGRTLDAWNGYPRERDEILALIEDQGIDNVVILTGSYHVALAFDVTARPVDIRFEGEGADLTPFYSTGDNYDPATGEGSVAVEFAAPSMTSNNFDENFGQAVALITQQLINQNINLPGIPRIGNPNPHLKYADLTSHGYYILDVKPGAAQADWYYSDILRVTGQEQFGQAWYTADGENHLQKAAEPSSPKTTQDTPAPDEPPAGEVTGLEIIDPHFTILGAYPNPFDHTNTLRYSLRETARVRIDLYDLGGRFVKALEDREMNPGDYLLEMDGSSLAEGGYVYRIRVNDRKYAFPVLVAR